MFHIVINLGADEKFEKEVKIAPKPPQVIESKPDAE